MENTDIKQEMALNSELKKDFLEKLEAKQQLFLEKTIELKKRSHGYVLQEVGMLDTLVGNCKEMVAKLLLK
jgi:hypothetical protein